MTRARHATALTVALTAVLAVSGLAGCESAPASTRPPAHAAPHEQPRASASDRASRPLRYVALGDSYTSAPGVQPVDDTGCGRSRADYPHLLAHALPARLTDVSCAGATTADLLARSPAGRPAQLAAVTARTRLVTVGIGGNDLGLLRLAGGCRTAQECSHLVPVLTRRMQDLTRDLYRVLARVTAQAPRAQVVVVGYPYRAWTEETCAKLPFPADVLPMAEAVAGALDHVLAEAAKQAHADYLDLGAPSLGHGPCGNRPWITGIQGGAVPPLHPNAQEQAAVARLLEPLVRR